MLIHAKFVKPRIFPWASARVPEQINRVQEISGDLALNRDPLYEIGRVNLLGYRKRIPSFTGRLKQKEVGEMRFWYALANKEDPGTGDPHYIDEEDLKTTQTDLSAYLTNDANVFTGSIWFPQLRLSGFTLNIADPDAEIERNFNVISEFAYDLPGAYFAYDSKTCSGSGSFTDTLTLSPIPLAYALGKYIFRVLRDRAGVVSNLNEDEGSAPAVDTWAYDNGTKTVTVQTCQSGDVIKVYYESATAYTTTWADNDVDPATLLAEYAEISFKVGSSPDRIYTLQSVGIDITFDRQDVRGIGSLNVIDTDVKKVTTKVSLNRFIDDFTFEKMLANDTVYPYVDPYNYADNIQMQVKIFNETAHTTFKIGYLFNKMSPTAQGRSDTINDFVKGTTTLECDNVKISDDESEIAFA
jgi:hypothetical protein